jgi:hypothetical protein
MKGSMMIEQESLVSLRIPKHIWIEIHSDAPDACDVIVEMEDGTIYTAVFVTLDYLRRQMDLTHDLCRQFPEVVPVRFSTLDTPHIVSESLNRDVIEDTVDNLLALEIFESVFTQVTEAADPVDEATTTNGSGRRATQEVAAVVLSDVLVIEA